MIRDENGLLAGYVYVDFDISKVDVRSDVTKRSLGSDPITGLHGFEALSAASLCCFATSFSWSALS